MGNISGPQLAYRTLTGIAGEADKISNQFRRTTHAVRANEGWSDSYKAERIGSARDHARQQLTELGERTERARKTITDYQPDPIGDPDPHLRELQAIRADSRISKLSDDQIPAAIRQAGRAKDAPALTALGDRVAANAELSGVVRSEMVRAFPDSDLARHNAIWQWGAIRHQEGREALARASRVLTDQAGMEDGLRAKSLQIATHLATTRLAEQGIAEPQ